MDRPTKITFADMRERGVRGLLSAQKTKTIMRKLAVERNAKLAILSLSLHLAGCDKIDQFIEEERHLVKRVDALESQITGLNGRLAALQEEKQSENSVPYSDCVLNNMKGVTNDLAAQAVEESCLRKASVALSAGDAFKGATAGYGQLPRDQRFGLYVTLDNKSHYTLTEISIRVTNRKTNEQNTY